MREQGFAGNDLQGRFIRRAQQDGGREAGLVGLQPPARAHAPAISRLQSREPELRSWRAQVVPDGPLMLEEFCGHHRADGVRAEIIRAGRAAAIAVEARQGCPRAFGQFPTEHVSIGHGPTVAPLATAAWFANPRPSSYGDGVSTFAPSAPSHLPRTLGALLNQGYQPRTVKAEMQENLLARLRSGQPTLPGIIGFEETVGPQVERALLAGHDFVLLGERGQGKTRLIRSLISLLDEWMPFIAGSEINDEPTAPVSAFGRRLAADMGDDLPIAWRHRSERYGEKLATPDTSVGDLVGDIDPVKVAEGRSLGDPETIHFGLVPRTNRGIFAINELPVLVERIQVALLNVLEERDIQVRGYNLRLPLDMLVVASANPEDYTNRGRIITPLKDRFGAEIRTHYPLDLDLEVQLIEQEAAITTVIPRHLLDVVARFTRRVRESPAVDPRSGVSARFSIACAEELCGAALRRAAITHDDEPVARIGDLVDIVPAMRGKVEFDVAEEGREEETLVLLARQATAEVWRERLAGQRTRPFLTTLVDWFDEGNILETSDVTSGRSILDALGPMEGLGAVLTTVEPGMAETPGLTAAVIEFAAEGLWLTRRIDKDDTSGAATYASARVTEDDE